MTVPILSLADVPRRLLAEETTPVMAAVPLPQVTAPAEAAVPFYH